MASTAAAPAASPDFRFNLSDLELGLMALTMNEKRERNHCLDELITKMKAHFESTRQDRTATWVQKHWALHHLCVHLMDAAAAQGHPTPPQDQIRITRLILDVARKLRDAGQNLTDPFVRSIIKLTAITSFWLSKSLGVDGVELEETGPGERDMHPLERRAMAYFTAHQRGLITTTSHGLPHFSRLAPQYQRALKVGLKWDIEHSENPDFVSKSPLHPASPDRFLLITLAALGNTDPDHWSPFQQQMAFFGATLAKRFVDKVCRPGAQTPAATSSVVTGGVAGGTAGNANASTGAPHATTGEPSNTDSTSASYARARTHAPRWRWPMKGLINRFSTFFGRFNRKTQPDTAESVSSSVRGIPPSLASVTDHAAKLAAEQREMFYKQTLDEALAHAAADKREEFLKVYEQFKKLN